MNSIEGMIEDLEREETHIGGCTTEGEIIALLKNLKNDAEPLQKEDVVNHPNHYCTGKYECIDVMAETLGSEAVKDFCICNAFKYIYRHKHKNGVEDIKKAIWYLNKYVELTEEE